MISIIGIDLSNNHPNKLAKTSQDHCESTGTSIEKTTALHFGSCCLAGEK
jgi:hypothetical protein